MYVADSIYENSELGRIRLIFGRRRRKRKKGVPRKKIISYLKKRRLIVAPVVKQPVYPEILKPAKISPDIYESDESEVPSSLLPEKIMTELPETPSPEEIEEKATEVEQDEYQDEELSGITDFPSVQKAIAYIKSKVADLFKQDLVLRNQLDRVRKLKEIAKTKGRDADYAKLLILEKEIVKSIDRQKELESKVAKFGKYVGLSALPVILITLAIPTAALIALHYKKISAQKKSLELIEKGLLTPEEAKALTPSLLPSLGEIGSTAKYVAILGAVGIGGYILLSRR